MLLAVVRGRWLLVKWNEHGPGTRTATLGNGCHTGTVQNETTSAQRLSRGLEARPVADVKDLHALIDSLHKPAQSRAGPQFDKARKSLRDQKTHRILPPHRRSDLFH